jgi:hypothetical protein
MDEMLEMAGNCYLLEQVTGIRMPPDSDTSVSELDDLLLVRGRPEVNYALRRRLATDFKQKAPFVISVPLQSIAIIPARPAPWDEKAEAPPTPMPAGR